MENLILAAFAFFGGVALVALQQGNYYVARVSFILAGTMIVFWGIQWFKEKEKYHTHHKIIAILIPLTILFTIFIADKYMIQPVVAKDEAEAKKTKDLQDKQDEAKRPHPPRVKLLALREFDGKAHPLQSLDNQLDALSDRMVLIKKAWSNERTCIPIDSEIQGDRLDEGVLTISVLPDTVRIMKPSGEASNSNLTIPIDTDLMSAMGSPRIISNKIAVDAPRELEKVEFNIEIMAKNLRPPYSRKATLKLDWPEKERTKTANTIEIDYCYIY